MMSDHINKKLSDEVLMAYYIKSKDTEYFNQIYKRYYVSLAKFISWLSQDLELGKDIAQNVLIKVYMSPQLYDPARNFKVWLFAMAKNQWKNEWRNHTTKTKHLEMISKQLTLAANEKELEDTHKKMQKIYKAMGQLSAQHREVMVLKYSNNLTLKEISELIDCSEGTVKSRLYYALRHLKKITA